VLKAFEVTRTLDRDVLSDHDHGAAGKPTLTISDTRGAEAISDTQLRELLRFWAARRAGAAAPVRAAIDPVEMPRHILPHLTLCDVITTQSGRRYRYRIVGTELVAVAGYDPTWRYLDEVLPERDGYREQIIALCDAVAAHRRPVYSEGAYINMGAPSNAERPTFRLLLPLAGPDGEVTHILGGQIFRTSGLEPVRDLIGAGKYRVSLAVFIDPDAE